MQKAHPLRWAVRIRTPDTGYEIELPDTAPIANRVILLMADEGLAIHFYYESPTEPRHIASVAVPATRIDQVARELLLALHQSGADVRGLVDRIAKSGLDRGGH